MYKSNFVIRAVYTRFFKKLLFILQAKYVVKDEGPRFTVFTVETLSYDKLLAIETIAENIATR